MGLRVMVTVRAIFLLVLGLAVLIGPEATNRSHASTTSVGVLELHIGAPASMTRTTVNRIAERLADVDGLKVLSRQLIVSTLSDRFSGAPRTGDEGISIEVLRNRLKKGESLVYSDPAAARQVLSPLRDDLMALVSQESIEGAAGQALFSTLMLLATTHYFEDNAAIAKATLAQVVRVFGESVEVTDETYHPNVVSLFQATAEELAARRTGTLRVTSEPSGAEVLIDGRLMAKRTPATFDELYLGARRVAVRLEDGRTSQRSVAIDASPITLDFDVPLESSAVFNETSAGLRFSTPIEARENVAASASVLGGMLNVDRVIVAGQVELDGEVRFVAYSVDVETASLIGSPVSQPTQGDSVSPSAIEEVVAQARSRAGAGAAIAWLDNYVGWSLAGAGVIVLGSGLGVLGHYLGQQSEFDRGWSLYDCDAPGTSGFTNAEAQCNALEEQRGLLAAESVASGVLIGVGAAALIGGVVAFVLMENEAIANHATPTNRTPRLTYLGPVQLSSRGHGAGFTLQF